MDPAIWGPHLWFFLHSMSFCYAENRLSPTKTEKKDMYIFLKSLRTVLPCTVCKENYSNYFNLYPPRLNSRKELFEWLVDLHNHVNTEVSKKGDYSNYSYTDVEKMYKSIYKK